MPYPVPLFHSLLRPCVLQILRAQGYHAARSSVIDTLTDMAARYLMVLCETTAAHAAHNSTEITGLVPSIVDVRMALEDCGALPPPPAFDAAAAAAGTIGGGDDVRGVLEFLDWVYGPRNREIKRVALDGDDENTDYLGILKKKHSKTGEDSKYSSTVLGRGTVGELGHGELVVEGGESGEFASIASWQEKRIAARQQPRPPTPTPADDDIDDDDDDDDEGGDRHARSPSSGLSSLGDQAMDEDMERAFGVAPTAAEG